ncbi:hypothetical protein KFL_000490280 [Klebsormidium nitens]|uniref:BTB domain-containing protein n=1 Tax=Klebsormidium nitens TaxID=105231 RepID=A0A0U9HIK4_KLENI|nr:hypothetical protein KFL_000490280 [Klebsormidium nitens]|eukprot:GAQ80238.1 hypothetical protein KFL_000490280 [Klebsormidium nitens]
MAAMQGEADAAGVSELPPKPWKQRRSKRSSVEGPIEPADIEIFEGKVQSSSVPSAVKPTSVAGYTKVRTGDGFQFAVPTVVLLEAEQVKLMLNSNATFKEKAENVVYFQEIRGEVLEVVLRFCFEEYLNKARVEQLYGASGPRPRLAFHFEVAPALAMEIISAAHFLGLKELLQLAAAMVAHHLSDVPDVSTLPKDLAWVVAQQLSLEGLLEAEDREDFQAIGLDTSPIWERLCRTRGWTGTSSLGLPEQSDLGELSPFDPAAPDYWKRVYVTHDLHFASVLQTEEKFPAFCAKLQRWGRFAAFQMVGRPFYEDVLLPYFGEHALVRYAALFPELRWLLLSQLDGKVLQNQEIKVEGTTPPFDFEALLWALPTCQVFDARFISDSRARSATTDEAVESGGEADALSRGVGAYGRLRMSQLKLAYNPLTSEELWAILRSLPSSSLKTLDLSYCDLDSSSAPLDVLEGLRGSILEALLLSGNPFGMPQRKPEEIPVVEGSWRKVSGIWRKTVQTASPRRAPKAPPKKPAARKKGPVKRPEWNLCFDNVEGDGGESSSAAQTPVGDDSGGANPGGDKPDGKKPVGANPGEANQGGPNPDEDISGGDNRGEANPGGANPGRDGPGGDTARAVGGKGTSRDSEEDRPATSSGAGDAKRGPESCQPSESGAERNSVDAFPGTSLREGGASCGPEQVTSSSRQSPGDNEPGASTAGEASQSAPHRTEQDGGGAGDLATENGVPDSASIRTADPDRKGKDKIEDGTPGSPPYLAESSEHTADRKGKAKVDEGPSTVSDPPVDDASSRTETSAFPGEVRNGRHNGAESSEKFPSPEVASTAADVPAIIFGSILTSLPPTLKKLALSDCGLGDVHVAQIVRGLTSAGCALWELDLSQNEVSARGASAVFVWLQHNDSLRHLSLAQNKVTSTCTDDLLGALQKNTTLSKLSLAGNYSFGEERVSEVLEAAREHAELLVALETATVFSLDLSFIDVTYAARNRFRDTYAGVAQLDLRI